MEYTCPLCDRVDKEEDFIYCDICDRHICESCSVNYKCINVCLECFTSKPYSSSESSESSASSYFPIAEAEDSSDDESESSDETFELYSSSESSDESDESDESDSRDSLIAKDKKLSLIYINPLPSEE